MVAFSKIKAGETLYDCHMQRMGNTTMRRMGTWAVKVLEVYPEKQSALVSWNCNRPQVWGLSKMQKLRRTPADKSKPSSANTAHSETTKETPAYKADTLP